MVAESLDHVDFAFIVAKSAMTDVFPPVDAMARA
jgi:hypothetical protein